MHSFDPKKTCCVCLPRQRLQRLGATEPPHSPGGAVLQQKRGKPGINHGFLRVSLNLQMGTFHHLSVSLPD